MSKKRQTGPRSRKTVRLIDKIAFKQLRKELSMDQFEFAEKAGVYASAVSRLEQGQNVELRSAEAIAQLLGRSVQDLFVYASNATIRVQRDRTLGQPQPRSKAPRLHRPEPKTDGLTAVERMAEEELFKYPGGHVNAIRLYGSADRYFPPEELKFYYRHNPYKIPDELRPRAEARIAELSKEAKAKGGRFFNGPNVRLQHFWPSPPKEGAGAGVERDVLRFYLEPVGWFDYEGTNGFVRDELDLNASEPYEYWIVKAYQRFISTPKQAVKHFW